MTNSAIINELSGLVMEAALIRRRADAFEAKANRLRNLLEGVSTPSARKGRKSGLTDQEKIGIAVKFNERLHKRCNK